MIDEFTLADGEKLHPLWLRLKAHLTDKLHTARVQISRDVDMTEQQTAALRGRVKCLEGIIALGDDRPVLTGN